MTSLFPSLAGNRKATFVAIVAVGLALFLLPIFAAYFGNFWVRVMAMALLYVLFAKAVPIISIWELHAGDHPSPDLVPPATEEHPLGKLHL